MREEGRPIFADQHIEKMIEGDEAAFRLFVETYRTYLYQVVYSVLHHAKDAEDVTQEVFIQIYLSLSHYRSQGFKTWITRIAVNKAIDAKRKQRRRKEELEERMEEVVSSDTVSEDAEAPLLQKEKQLQLHDSLQELSPSHRRAVYAYYFEGKSYKEIAAETGVATKTVESALYRAKQLMRKNWREEP
ncbi:RNA polymerase sigma factor [Brevibacillus fluminis]|uniref:RNA polymerase sigma factor n=1 Tax=Brevibacillus fluminis TaxID=511487 RepID=A0A3M8DAS1_9BACL|nr:RNA polymerase sigma factor [Brevibacillus fluminis]RNB85136.1 RNA polymerase sigma factor [Brevibacillus fluminis]